MGMNFAETASSETAVPRLPDALRLGAVELTVADVDRSVAWYQSALGLRVHRQDVGVAELGDGTETVLVLVEDAQARPAGATPACTTTRCCIPAARSWPAPPCAWPPPRP